MPPGAGHLARFFEDRGVGKDRPFRHIDHGGKPLSWPGSPAGFPYRGEKPPITTQAEADQMPHAYEFHCRMFQLWIPEDLEAYTQVMDWISNGLFLLMRREFHFNDEHKHYQVWVEWSQVYAEQRGGLSRG